MLTRVGSHPLGWASNFKVSARSEWFLGMDRLAAPTGQRDRITEVNFVRRHSSRAANECRFHSDHDAPDKTLWLAGVSSAGRIGCGVR
jgi:hypothetical protein